MHWRLKLAWRKLEIIESDVPLLVLILVLRTRALVGIVPFLLSSLAARFSGIGADLEVRRGFEGGKVEGVLTNAVMFAPTHDSIRKLVHLVTAPVSSSRTAGLTSYPAQTPQADQRSSNHGAQNSDCPEPRKSRLSDHLGFIGLIFRRLKRFVFFREWKRIIGMTENEWRRGVPTKVVRLFRLCFMNIDIVGHVDGKNWTRSFNGISEEVTRRTGTIVVLQPETFLCMKPWNSRDIFWSFFCMDFFLNFLENFGKRCQSWWIIFWLLTPEIARNFWNSHLMKPPSKKIRN